jgi:hypothetical protein
MATKNNTAFEFMSACDRTFSLFGAAYEEKDHPYAWTFDTGAGALYCHAIEDGAFCRFAHPDRAKAIIGAGSLNPYSGKWNWHYNKPGLDELLDLQRHLIRVVRVPQCVDNMVMAYQEALSGLGSPKTDTVLAYQYRDATNNTISSEVRLCGQPDTWDVGNRLRALLMLLERSSGNISFIPGQLGLPDLQETFGECKGHWDSELDQPWHSFTGLRPIRKDALSEQVPLMSYDQFTKNLVQLTTGPGWDETYLPPSHPRMTRRLSERQAAA